jgi:hypothetical protein
VSRPLTSRLDSALKGSRLVSWATSSASIVPIVPVSPSCRSSAGHSPRAGWAVSRSSAHETDRGCEGPKSGSRFVPYPRRRREFPIAMCLSR